MRDLAVFMSIGTGYEQRRGPRAGTVLTAGCCWQSRIRLAAPLSKATVRPDSRPCSRDLRNARHVERQRPRDVARPHPDPVAKPHCVCERALCIELKRPDQHGRLDQAQARQDGAAPHRYERNVALCEGAPGLCMT
jgi:hypothetical protein